MYCRKCGNEIPDNSAFCPKCGNSMTGKKDETEKKNLSIKHKGNRYKWVGVAMIALLAGGTAGVFSFLMASNIMEENTFLSFDFRPGGTWVFLLAAVAVTVLEICLFWLHFRRREVKL